MNLFENIAQLANLQYDNTVLIKESSELKTERLQSLINAGLCPRRAWLWEKYPKVPDMDLRFREQENLSRQFIFPSELSIIDKLGEYRSAKKEIVIFVEMCKIAAKSLGIGVNVLKKVVEAHEVAHAVTHLGKDNQGGIWDHFDKATSEDKELFAQIYPLQFFIESGDVKAEDCFRKLSEHQDSRYNSWRGYENTYLAQINRDLLYARLNRLGTSTIPEFGTRNNDTGKGPIPDFDTIIVPAWEETFKDVFLGESRWWPIRMGTVMTQPGKIKYIGVYRKAPISAVTHWASVKNILPWQDTGKFIVIFAERAWEIRPINLMKLGKVKAPRSPRYTSFDKLQKANTMDDLF